MFTRKEISLEQSVLVKVVCLVNNNKQEFVFILGLVIYSLRVLLIKVLFNI